MARCVACNGSGISLELTVDGTEVVREVCGDCRGAGCVSRDAPYGGGTCANHSVKRAGWCTECKERKVDCQCDETEPGSLFEQQC